MKQMKYIVVDNGALEAPVIFFEGVQHVEMATNIPGKLVSAGFVQFTPTGLECYGMSVSLGVAARPEEDSRIINKMLGVSDD